MNTVTSFHMLSNSFTHKVILELSNKNKIIKTEWNSLGIIYLNFCWVYFFHMNHILGDKKLRGVRKGKNPKEFQSVYTVFGIFLLKKQHLNTHVIKRHMDIKMVYYKHSDLELFLWDSNSICLYKLFYLLFL